jgi:hypothetical protein
LLTAFISKTYSVTHLNVKEAARRHSPAAVSHDVVSGVPAEILTSYAERQNLSLRMSSPRFTRLTNAFNKKLDNHVAVVALYVAHYNFCRVHETLWTTPAVALGITGHVVDKRVNRQALTAVPPKPTSTAPDRRRQFRVIKGGRGEP